MNRHLIVLSSSRELLAELIHLPDGVEFTRVDVLDRPTRRELTRRPHRYLIAYGPDTLARTLPVRPGGQQIVLYGPAERHLVGVDALLDHDLVALEMPTQIPDLLDYLSNTATKGVAA